MVDVSLRPRYFGIAAYTNTGGYPNFKDVTIYSFITRDEATRQVWVAGLQQQIAEHTPFTRRYVTIPELVDRLYSTLVAQTNMRGVIKTRSLAELFKGAQLTALTSAIAAKGMAPTKHTIDPKLLTRDVFTTLVMETLVYPPLFKVFTEHCSTPGDTGTGDTGTGDSGMGDSGTGDTGTVDTNTGDTRTGSTAEANSPAAGGMAIPDVMRFLTNEQRDPRDNEILHPLPTADKCAELIRLYNFGGGSGASNGGAGTEQPPILSPQGFARYILGPENDVLVSRHRKVYQDMQQPLAHYFIDSSHNTYLTGNQINSKSTVEMYRQILLWGCRCVEIDIWDGDDDIPIVYHGRTATTRVLFRDVMRGIADVAFTTTDFPVILSFENHCSLGQQETMARDVREAFGDMLCDRYAPGDGPDYLPQTLPSPEFLRGKIIVKNKRQKHLVVQQGGGRVGKGDGGSAISLLPVPDETETLDIVIDGELIEETEAERYGHVYCWLAWRLFLVMPVFAL